MINSENYISFINDFLDKYCPFINKILTDNDRIDLTNNYIDSKLFLIEYITRQSANLISINQIFKSTFDNIRFEHSIGLLLRNSLADTLFLFYINSPNNLKKGINKLFFQEEILKLNASQLVKTFNDNEIIDKDIINQYANLIEFDTNNKIKSKVGKTKSNKEIFKILESSATTKQFALIYFKWELYSKYEHYGELTPKIQTLEHNFLITQHILCISWIIHGITIAIMNIKEITNEFKIDPETEDIINEGLITITFKIIEIYKNGISQSESL